MAMLHTINKSPFQAGSLETCLDFAKDGSTVLLMEDGVYAAMSGTNVTDKINAANGISFCVLGPDAAARGIDDSRLADGIKVVDYEGFVDLVAEHDTVQAWL